MVWYAVTKEFFIHTLKSLCSTVLTVLNIWLAVTVTGVANMLLFC